mgnify:CR=1 FL=1
MSISKHSIVRAYLQDLGKKNNIPSQDVEHLIDQYFEELKVYHRGESKQLATITRGENNEIIIARSRKPANVRFHLGKLLYFIVKTGAAVVAFHVHPLTILFFIFDLLKDALEVTTIELKEEEGQLLLAIYELQLRRPNRVITTDFLEAQLQDSHLKARLAKRLSKLHDYGCITLNMDSITVTETIVIRNED